MGGKVKITTDGIRRDGKPAHSEWTRQVRRKDYAVTGVRIQTCAPTRRSMIAHWIFVVRKRERLLPKDG